MCSSGSLLILLVIATVKGSARQSSGPSGRCRGEFEYGETGEVVYGGEKVEVGIDFRCA